MKLILIISMLFLTSCASKVLVRQSTCEPMTSQFYICEEAE